MQISDLKRQQHMGLWFPHSLLEYLQRELNQADSRELQHLGQDIGTERAKMESLIRDQSEILESRHSRKARQLLDSGMSPSLLKF